MTDVSFWKELPVVKHQPLQELAFKMLSMYGTTYISECKFSKIKHTKLKHRIWLTDKTLSHLLCVATSKIEVNFALLLAVKYSRILNTHI